MNKTQRTNLFAIALISGITLGCSGSDTDLGGTTDAGPDAQETDDTAAPIITIDSPDHDAVTQRNVSVTGTVADDVGVASAELVVNGGTPIPLTVSAGGSFATAVRLDAEFSDIEIVARDDAGNESVAAVAVTVIATGVADNTFGRDLEPADGVPDGRLHVPDIGSNPGLAVDIEGRTLLAGSYAPLGSNEEPQLSVVRLNPDGSLDETFGVGGMARFAGLTTGTESSIAIRIVALADGKLAIAGRVRLTDDSRSLVIMRLNSDGTLDTSFGGDAHPADGIADGFTEVAAPDLFVGNLSIDANGRMIVAGQSGNPVGPTLWRFESTGALDTAFAPDGALTVPLPDPESGVARDVQADSQGGIVVVGSDGDSRPFIARINNDGDLDTAFAGVGFRVLSEDNGSALRVHPSPDGRWMVLASTGSVPIVYAVSSDGNTSESVEITPPATASLVLFSSTQDAAGNLVAVGVTLGHLRPFVVRIRPDLTIDSTFGNDTTPADGDPDGFFWAPGAPSQPTLTGLIAIDREGRILLGGNPATTIWRLD